MIRYLSIFILSSVIKLPTALLLIPIPFIELSKLKCKIYSERQRNWNSMFYNAILDDDIDLAEKLYQGMKNKPSVFDGILIGLTLKTDRYGLNRKIRSLNRIINSR